MWHWSKLKTRLWLWGTEVLKLNMGSTLTKVCWLPQLPSIVLGRIEELNVYIMYVSCCTFSYRHGLPYLITCSCVFLLFSSQHKSSHLPLTTPATIFLLSAELPSSNPPSHVNTLTSMECIVKVPDSCKTAPHLYPLDLTYFPALLNLSFHIPLGHSVSSKSMLNVHKHMCLWRQEIMFSVGYGIQSLNPCP